MKMKSVLLLVLTMCLMICLCACGNDAPADDTSKTTQNNGNATTTTTTTQAATTTTTTAQVDANKATYSVTVTDEGGNPISGAFVQLCLESCIPCMTNEQGVATYPNMNKADYKVSFINVPEGYSVETNEFHFEEGSYEMTIILKAVA